MAELGFNPSLWIPGPRHYSCLKQLFYTCYLTYTGISENVARRIAALDFPGQIAENEDFWPHNLHFKQGLVFLMHTGDRKHCFTLSYVLLHLTSFYSHTDSERRAGQIAIMPLLQMRKRLQDRLFILFWIQYNK